MPGELPLLLRHPLPVLLRHHAVDPARALLPGVAVAAVGVVGLALLPAVALFPTLAAVVGALLPAVVVITLLPTVLAVSVIIITFFCHAAIIANSVAWPVVWTVRVALLKT